MRSLFPLVVLAVSITFAADAAADCTAGGVYSMQREGMALPSNAKFLVDAFGVDRGQLTQLAKAGALFVRQGKRWVPLSADVRLGESGTHQFWLSPKAALSKGEWQLDVRDEYKTATVRALRSIRWTVSGVPDLEAPVWQSAPEYVKSTRVEFGCGPSIHHTIAVDLPDNTIVELNATVKTKTETEVLPRILLVAQGGFVSLGHGMCGGLHRPRDGTYTVQLTAYDNAGNASAEPFRGAFSFTPKFVAP